MTGPSDLEVRHLGPGDRSELEAFSCQNFGEPWTSIIEEMIRHYLPANLDGAFVSGLGAWLDGRLAGLVVWQPDDDDPLVLRSSVLAVRNGVRRRGIGRLLKEALLSLAVESGATAVVSIVHWDNDAMIRLNEPLGANVERIPGDDDHCLCVIPIKPRDPDGITPGRP